MYRRVCLVTAVLLLVVAASASANTKDASSVKASKVAAGSAAAVEHHHGKHGAAAAATAASERKAKHHHHRGHDEHESEKFSQKKLLQPAPPTESPQCHPECRWQCDDPICPADCHPLCNPSECEIECHEGPCAECQVQCEEPECTVRCPKEACEKDECPKCETVCAPPKCAAQCTPPEPICAPVCAPTQCRLSCNKPMTCPRPKCELVCEKTNCSVGQAPWDEFAETHCCPCTAFTLNIAMISANEHRFKQRIPAVVEGHGKNQAKAGAAAAVPKPVGPLVVAAVKHKSSPADGEDQEEDESSTGPIGSEDEDYMSLIEVLHTEHHSRTQGTSEMCCPCNSLTPVPINVPNPYEGEATVKFTKR